ncbi:BTB domain-containing protein [Favolaschia claudopus]|uniref:BTB domain-containing protein n=1 Tax=Favolaschia claudopus TaxID=2862362 RepID=A0AAW0EDW2_9AGAR
MSRSDSAKTPTRIKDLWFANADLVLRAENSIFRVYSGILGARSSVFRDMIAFPQPSVPSAQEDTIDGCNVVQLHDKAAEAEVFLRAVFDSSFFMPPPSCVEFVVVIGVLRLAHKYDVQYLFQRALSHLGSMYPADFTDLLDAVGSVEDLPCDDMITTGDVEHIMAMISLRAALEVGATWLLPGIYYNIVFSVDFMNHAAKYLQTDEIQACLAAQIKFMRAQASSYRFMRDLPLDSCPCWSECKAALAEAYTELDFRAAEHSDIDPLAPFVFENTAIELCATCDEFSSTHFAEAQQTFWGSLPSIFGLPEWDELDQMRRKAMNEEA